jgi:hypothetical protein
MDPVRFKPAVELPVRRTRPLALGAALALLFIFGIRSSLERTGGGFAASRPGPIVRLDLASEPSGATVVRERDDRPMCVTPCALGLPADTAVTAFRFMLPGHADRRVLIDLGGGDTQVEVVLQPLR